LIGLSGTTLSAGLPSLDVSLGHRSKRRPLPLYYTLFSFVLSTFVYPFSLLCTRLHSYLSGQSVHING